MAAGIRPPTSNQQIENKQEEDTHTIIIESQYHLRPDTYCLQSHGKGKSRLLTQKETCGTFYDCDASKLVPNNNNPLFYRLPGSLTRLLTTPNASFADGRAVPSKYMLPLYLSNPTYTPSDFRSALKVSLQNIHWQHGYIAGLEAYAAREPYDRNWRFRGKAYEVASLPTDGEVDLWDDETLRKTAVEVAEEFTYLCKEAEYAEACIIEMKWDRAEMGDVSEIEQLLKWGIVSLEQVREFCVLL